MFTTLATLGEACEKTEWQVHAYCPMWEAFRQESLAAVAERVGPNHKRDRCSAVLYVA